MLSPFEWWCRNFILPDICKPCLFVFLRNLFYLTFNFDVKHEDYKEWLNQIEQVSDADCSLLSEPDPYTKCVRSPEIQKSAAAKMDANGNIHAGNISAYWIPQITLQREIGGTVYTVTGYYEGKTDFLRKLERMTVDRMRRAMEDDIDDK